MTARYEQRQHAQSVRAAPLGQAGLQGAAVCCIGNKPRLPMGCTDPVLTTCSCTRQPLCRQVCGCVQQTLTPADTVSTGATIAKAAFTTHLDDLLLLPAVLVVHVPVEAIQDAVNLHRASGTAAKHSSTCRVLKNTSSSRPAHLQRSIRYSCAGLHKPKQAESVVSTH